MSTDRKNQDMTQAEADIALLLADATDAVEIGTAPVQAVLRGGRRRRTRRWAVATATAVAVLAGSAGVTLAVTGLPGEHRSQVATPVRHVDKPQVTELAHGTDQGRSWRVVISVWGAPRDKAEAAAQLDAMRSYGIDEDALPALAHLVGKTSYYTSLFYGEDSRSRVLLFQTVKKWDHMAGRDIVFGSLPLKAGDPERDDRLVVGRVARTAQLVQCDFEGGTKADVRPTAAAGSPVNWFVCLGPKGQGNKTAGVIK
ncbi:hypothetical protein [Streptomyces sp. NPDC048282]|uniref:hypothetical protein n=1 Tax=Streptomyces sp. NPDC048282 TaxID=3365528 RepID=UPI003720144A